AMDVRSRSVWVVLPGSGIVMDPSPLRTRMTRRKKRFGPQCPLCPPWWLGRAFGEDSFDLGMGPWNDVDGDELADPASSGGAGIGSGFHRAHIATDHHGDVPGADVFLADQDDVRRLDHGVSRLD